jgi:hypothetical protein
MEIFPDTGKLDEIGHPLTHRGPAGFLEDWEKGAQMLGGILEPARAREARP